MIDSDWSKHSCISSAGIKIIPRHLPKYPEESLFTTIRAFLGIYVDSRSFCLLFLNGKREVWYAPKFLLQWVMKSFTFCLISKQFQCMKKRQTVSVKNYFENFRSLSLIIPNYRVKFKMKKRNQYMFYQTGFCMWHSEKD